jgi:DNA gyrase subunit A
VDQEPAAVSTEDLIQAEQDAVIITRSGRIKRVPLAAFQGKKGEFTAAEEADISGFFVTHPHDEILIFTSAGRFFRIKGHAVNVETRNGKGADLRAMLSLVGDEAVIFSLMDRGLDREATFVATCTEFGMMKRTSLSEYSSSKPEGIAALKLEGKDRLRWVALSDGKKDLMAFTAKGLAVRFPEGKVRAMGRPSLGVTGIRMGDHDEIISFAAVSGTEDVMTVSSSGRGKRTPLVEYRATERGNRGIVSSRLEEGERLVGAVVVADADKVVVRTEKGNMSVVVSSVKKAGRATKGGKVVEGVVTGMEKVTVWER